MIELNILTMFKRNSFSLVEVIVATCIFLVLVNMAFVTLNTGMSSWFSGGVSVELRNEIIKAFGAMEKELKETASAKLDNLPSGSSAAYLIFRLPQDIDNDGTIIDWSGVAPMYEPTIEWSLTNVTYQLNASKEIIRTSSGQSRIIARNISTLQFSRPSAQPDILQIDITAQKNDSKGRVINDTARLMIKMRNN